MNKKQQYRYPGNTVDVEWDSRLCIHIGECGRAKGDLFVGGRKPWCVPDLVSQEEVIDVIKRCPTGALTYHCKDSNVTELPDGQNTITLTYNGPYFVRGHLHIEGAAKNQPGLAFRAALCRCGQSKNKPFCDNSHEDVDFKDYGAVGEAGEPLAVHGGPVHINPAKNGPLVVTGNFTIKSSSGRNAWTGTKTVLCRCGASKNKPFCDGSHAKIGFQDA